MFVHKNGLGELHREPMLDTSVNENFVKNSFFGPKSNFDQASQEGIKNSILYGKLSFRDATYGRTIVMSQFRAPNYSYKSDDKNPVICYQIKINETFGNLCHGKVP